MAKVITGTGSADNITVQESGVTINAGAGHDTVHLKKGTGNTVNGQAGHDTVYVYTGTHTVYGGAGDDTMVTWGNAGDGSRFEGGTGNDSVKIKGGNNHVIIMGDGTLNTVNLNKGSGHSITGSNTGVDRLFICSDDVTNIKANLQNGENRATLWGGSDNTITGGDDTDIFNLKGGKKNSLYGGAGQDYLIIHTGEQNSVYGGDGNDRLTVWHNSGDQNNLYGEGGNDIIEVNGGNEHRIDGGDGYNQVKLKGGDRHTYTGGSGKDIVNISGGDGHTVNAGDGANRITVYSGTGHVITGGKNTDIINISGGTVHNVDGGTGDDKYIINTKISKYYPLNIVQSSAGNNDIDTLSFTKYSKTDFTFYEDVLSPSNLVLKSSSNEQIIINDWENHPFNKIIFSDGTLTTSQINSKIKKSKIIEISEGGTYKGTSGQDLFEIKAMADGEIPFTINITNISSNDIVKFDYSNYYARWFYMEQLGNDLIISRKTNTNSESDNYGKREEVIIKNYFGLSGSVIFYEGRNDTYLTLKAGTDGEPVLNGTDGSDIIFGGFGTKLLYGGDGDDIIYTGWYYSDQYNGYLGTKIVYGGDGNDKIYGYGRNPNGHSSGGYFWNQHVLYGGKGEDYIYLTSFGNVFGGDGDDNIEINSYTSGDIKAYGGTGNDNININKNSYSGNIMVEGGTGDDYIDITAKGVQFVLGGDGNDQIYSRDGTSELYGDKGNDYIYIASESDSFAFGGEGNDKFEIASGFGSHSLYGSTGEDDFIIDMSSIDWYSYITNENQGLIRVYNTDDGYTADEDIALLSPDANGYNTPVVINSDREDTLMLQNVDINHVRFNLNKEFDLVISDMYNKNTLIEVANWYTHPLKQIIFEYSDVDNNLIKKSYTPEDINKIMSSTCYYASYSRDSNNSLIYTGPNIIYAKDKIRDFIEASHASLVYGIGDGDIIDLGMKPYDFKVTYSVDGNDLIIGSYECSLKNYFSIKPKNVSIVYCNNGWYQSISLSDELNATGIQIGSVGNDTLNGTSGDDTLHGGIGNDSLYGNNGNDVLYGGYGDDTLDGGTSDDWLYGQEGDDELTGGAGKDNFVYTDGGGKDTIKDYNAVDDTLYIYNGSISNVTLANGDKDVVYTIGAGSVTLNDAAASTVNLKDSRGSYTASNKTITLNNDFNGTMKAEVYLDTVLTVNGKAATGVVDIYGNNNDNIIYGNEVNNSLYGYAGNDKLYGYDGNDYLDGGSGNDYLDGGSGNDYLYGDEGNDSLYGGDGDDVLYGYSSSYSSYYSYNYGNNYLYGEKGNDHLNGGKRDDFLSGGEGNDVFEFGKQSERTCTIQDYEVGLDIIKFNDGIDYSSSSVDGSDVLLNLTTGGRISIVSAAGKNITFDYGNGNTATKVFT